MVIKSHVEWLKKKFGSALVTRTGEEGYSLSQEDIFEELCAADDENQYLVDWMVKKYLANPRAFRWEDVREGKDSKVSRTLNSFKRYKHLLPPEARDIYQYQTISSLYIATAPFEQKDRSEEEAVVGSRAIKRAERERALQESKVLWRDGDMIVAVPLTMRASQWWGRGTQWCTAADRSNYFNEYNKDAPLIVIIIGGEKYQLHVTQGEYQFMDENDAEVEADFVSKNWKKLAPIMWWAFEICPDIINLLPLEEINYSVEKSAVARHGELLKLIPYELRTQELCDVSMNSRDDGFEFIPPERLTREIMFKTKVVYKEYFNQIPNHLKTEETIMYMLSGNGHLLSLLPEEQITEDMIDAALAQNWHVIHNIEDRKLSSQNWITAIRSMVNGPISSEVSYRIFGMKEIDNAVILELVEKDPMQAFGLPENSISEELALIAIKEYSSFAKKVSMEMWNIDFAKKAVAINGLSFEHVPSDLQSEDLLAIAVKAKNHPFYEWEKIPKEWLTAEFYLHAVQSDRGRILAKVPDQYWTSELVMKAAQYDATVVTTLLEIYENQEKAAQLDQNSTPWDWPKAFLDTARINSLAYQYIPQEFKDKKLSLSLWEKSPWIIEFMSKEDVSKELVVATIKKDRKCWTYMPEEYRTKEMYQLSYETWGTLVANTIPTQWKGEIVGETSDEVVWPGIDLDALSTSLSKYLSADEQPKIEGLKYG